MKTSRFPSRASTAAALIILLLAAVSAAAGTRSHRVSFPGPAPVCGPDTLWVFDAHFEDLSGDNSGWTAYDMSGTVAQANQWHRDTIRVGSFPYLGQSTWWCGTYNASWRQPRGYGNGWTQILRRDFQLGLWSVPGDSVSLEFDQRFAMERNYDFGYVDASTDNGVTWTTVAAYTNPAAGGAAGRSVDWNDPEFGSPVLDMSSYAGSDITIRFRFESDAAFSSQDQYADPPLYPCFDGAWQLDNFAWRVNGELLWADDCESNDDNGWVHEDVAGSGQTGVTFWRAQLGFDIDLTDPVPCVGEGQWVYAAVTPFGGQMVDNENAWLVSPPIDISGAERLVAQWRLYVDAPGHTGDLFDIWVNSSDDAANVQDPALFFDEEPGAWYGVSGWGTWTDDWTALVGADWLGVCWKVFDEDSGVPGAPLHGSGVLIDRFRVGVTIDNDAGPSFDYPIWDRFHDWFEADLTEAIVDTALVRVSDYNGVAAVWLRASVDGGQLWWNWPLQPPESGNVWRAPPPASLMQPGTEICYYFGAEDAFGNVSYFPEGTETHPERALRFSILPIHASPDSLGILLVDKYGGSCPGESRSWRPSLDYYTEALQILGYEFDTYHTEVPGASTPQSDGPDRWDQGYYDTQIWFTGPLEWRTLTTVDQHEIIEWFEHGAMGGEERNLLVAGNDIGRELIALGQNGWEFYDDRLGVDYQSDGPGAAEQDTCPGLRDAGHGFMDWDDGECILAGACPAPERFDVGGLWGEAQGTLTPVCLYVDSGLNEYPAGVAFDADFGYQSVTLGFGLEYMMDGTVLGGSGNYAPSGHYLSAIGDRTNLLGNIMEYFGKPSQNPSVGISDDSARNRFGHACPNPFNPTTRIFYSVRDRGPVRIEIFSVAGRSVRTLLDANLVAGNSGFAVWDGRDEVGEECASGVYFCRMIASGFEEERKLVLVR